MAVCTLFLFGLLISLTQGNYWFQNENSMEPGFARNYINYPQLCISKQQGIVGECSEFLRLSQVNQYEGQPYYGGQSYQYAQPYQYEQPSQYEQPYPYVQPYQGASLIKKAIKGYKILHGIVKAIKKIHKNSKREEQPEEAQPAAQ